ncbi:MAG: glycosyltransferase [Flavobacteriales bacterium]
MKIAYIIPILGCGGAEVLLGAIIENLHKLGHEVLLICLEPPHTTYQNFPNRDFIDQVIKPKIINSRVKFSIKSKPLLQNDELKKIIDDFKPDIIHSHLFAAEIVSRSYIYHGAKYFSHGHDNMPQFRPLSLITFFKRRYLTDYIEFKWLIQQYRKSNTHFISISADVDVYLKRCLPTDLASRVHLIRNGFQYSRYYVDRTHFTSNDQKLRIVSVGNLVPKKNHAFLIDIALELRRLNIDFQIDILGYGVLFDRLMDLIKANELDDKIFLRGNVGNVRDYLAQANIYVHPATYEPLGLVLLEAMAAGLPVVSLDGKGNRDIIEHGKNGFIFTECNSSQFTEAIIQLWKDEKLYNDISKYAQNYARQYDIEIYVKRLLELYYSA